MALTLLNSAMIEIPATISTLSANTLKTQILTSTNIEATNVNTTDIFVTDVNFPATGGNMINDIELFGNLTVFGGVTATGTDNTLIFSTTTTTTALSIVNLGIGTALDVNQDSSTGPVASFKGNDIEVLRINNTDPDSGQPGVVVSYSGTGNSFVVERNTKPNAFVVNSLGNTVLEGTLSAKDITGDLITGTDGNSNLWNTAYNWSTTYSNNSAKYESVYSNVKFLSASWEETEEILPTITDYLSTNQVILCSAEVKDTITAVTLTAENITVNTFTILSSNQQIQFNDIGQPGTIKWDENYLYVCIAENDWKRVALSAW